MKKPRRKSRRMWRTLRQGMKKVADVQSATSLSVINPIDLKELDFG